jgi:alpha-glucosidase
MALQTEVAWDWSKTTAKRTVWKPQQRAKNIFEGKSTWEKARVENTDVLRLSVLPATAKLIADSFAVIKEPQWSGVEKPQLPLGFEWQQSRPARFDIYFQLADELKCHALGERFSGLNVRGEKHTIVSTDNPHHNEAIDPMYKPIPFLIVGNRDKFYGIFLDTPAPSRFDLDSELTEEGHIELFTRRGFRVYILGPGSLADIVKSFTHLVGRTKLPPLWSIGHQQSRWSYPDEQTVRAIAQEFRARKIPCDTLVIDMDYMDGYRVFTIDKKRFPNFEKLLSDLAADHFKVVSSVNPGLKEEESYRLFAECLKRNFLCKTFDGKLFLDRVWPGSTAFPDFLKAEVRDWWAKEQSFLS